MVRRKGGNWRFAVAHRQGFSVRGPALLGLGAVAIAAAWIFLFFVVIPPIFG